jgi:hypothetical protein
MSVRNVYTCFPPVLKVAEANDVPHHLSRKTALRTRVGSVRTVKTLRGLQQVEAPLGKGIRPYFGRKLMEPETPNGSLARIRAHRTFPSRGPQQVTRFCTALRALPALRCGRCLSKPGTLSRSVTCDPCRHPRPASLLTVNGSLMRSRSGPDRQASTCSHSLPQV